MQSGITNHSSHPAFPASAAYAARVDPHTNVPTAQLRKHAFKRYLRVTVVAVTISTALSGCGVFCGGAGGSGGGFAGGCATGVRF
jgi:hypothetical protein